MADSFDQVWHVGRREAVSITLTGTTNPSGGTFSGRLATTPGGTPLVADIAVTAGGSSPLWTLTVALTSTHTNRAAGTYFLEVWDAVTEQRRAAGQLKIGPTIPSS